MYAKSSIPSPKKKPNRPVLKHQSDISKVPINKKGGVLVTEEEVKVAFNCFDKDDTGKLTIQRLRKLLSFFNKNLSEKEIRIMLNGSDGLNLQDVKNILLNNEVTNFDPFAEIFEVLDPEGTGCITSGSMKRAFNRLDFDLSDDEVQILVKCAGNDKDGKISLEDFRNMLISTDAGTKDLF